MSLATVACPRFVPDALAGAFGIAQPTGALTLEAVLAAVARRRMLLVLDNCEHLLDAAARIASALTDADDGLCVLATSRESLRIHGERVCPVLPLDVPDEGTAEHDAMRASAVRCSPRAPAADPRFPLDARSLSLMASVCRRLDGLPLAIELAAARAAVLGIDVLAAHLDDHFRLLTGGFRTALPRHQTLQAMYDWSDRLLGDAERLLLRWLGVFRDGFSIEAVRAVVGERAGRRRPARYDRGPRVEIAADPRDRARRARYRLLTTTRAYAQQQLDAHGDGAAAARAHAGYFLALFRQAAHGGGARAAITAAPRSSRRCGVNSATCAPRSTGHSRRTAMRRSASRSRPSRCLACSTCRSSTNAANGRAWRSMRCATPTPRQRPPMRACLLAAYAAALAHTAGSTQAVHDAWSEVHALGFDAAEAELPARDG